MLKLPENNIKTKTLPEESNEMAKIVPSPLQIMAFWNQQPHLRGHTDQHSKIYKASLEMIDDLMQGHFSSKYPLNSLCIEINRISPEELEREWSQEEIQEAIERFNYMMSPEYINNKQFYPKSLPDFIYNFRTEHSFIFSVLGDREVFGRPVKAIDDFIFKIYKRTFFNFEMNQEQLNRFTKNVNYICLQQQDFEKRVGQHCFFHPLKEKMFYLCHIEYIQEVYEGKESFDWNYVGPLTYQGFVEWVNERLGAEIYPSKQNLAKIKEKFEQNAIKLEEANKAFNEILNKRRFNFSKGLNRFQIKENECEATS